MTLGWKPDVTNFMCNTGVQLPEYFLITRLPNTGPILNWLLDDRNA